jgi:hypothetical protein
MGTLLFDDEALDFLSKADYDPDAKRSYEIMSDSFVWSDELLLEAFAEFSGAWPFRELMAYRRSVILCAPDSRLRPVWEQMAKACPEWPGLRPERSSPTLAAALVRERQRACVEFERLERELEREAPDA